MRKNRAASDAKRARDRAEVARAALGIGKKIYPRRPLRPAGAEPQPAVGGSPGARRGSARPAGSPPAVIGGRGKASPQPRRPSAGVVRNPGGAAAGAKENGLVSNGKGDDGGIDGGAGRFSDRAFQRVQNLRGVLAGDAGEAVQRRRSPEPGRRAREEGEVVGVVAGTDEAARNLEAFDLARRRRAARAVFGIGFGDQHEGEPSVSRADNKDVMLKVSATTTLPCGGATVERNVAGRPRTRAYLACMYRLFSGQTPQGPCGPFVLTSGQASTR